MFSRAATSGGQKPARRPSRHRTGGRAEESGNYPSPLVFRARGARGLAAIVRARRRLHDVAGEQPDDALAIALDAEQALALTGAEQVLQRAEPVLAFVELRIDATHELLGLTHVHGEARRV